MILRPYSRNVAFDSASAYGRFMGRFSEPLAPVFADWVGLDGVDRVLDVGCGPGQLTAELVRRLSADSVAAVDPSPPFVAAARRLLPDVDIRVAAAESMPFDDGVFDVALAQLVVHFMADPLRGVREMARVTRPGGVIAACVWDHAGGRGPLSPFWAVVRDLDMSATDESRLVGAREKDLHELFERAGLERVESGTLEVTVPIASFEDWWEPYTMGVGPAGDHVARLAPHERSRLQEACRERMPDGPFELTSVAWTARGESTD